MKMILAALLLSSCAGTRFVCRSVCMDKWKQCIDREHGGGNGTPAPTECDDEKQACLDCCRDQGTVACGGNQ